ncbi:gluconokinase [Rhodobacter sp. SY28-1]|uniref:gluconokinase n=1 Tax=Rhodobacter sp. SY28-1 TaxID=2562317 RepID=UPI0010BFFE0C|nr:gluconokinase [Rhodobacter sp. SY28-1]
MSLRVVIMGVAGCGKSSVGEGLSERLGVPYRDGDDLHTPEAVEKMRAGVPLTDADRWPWLDRVAGVLASGAPVIVGCSALKRVYRDRIRQGAGGPVRLVHLAGSREVIAARMAARTGHYMPTSLLDSQFAALEAPGPDEAVTVDIDQSLAAIVEAVLAKLDGGEP